MVPDRGAVYVEIACNFAVPHLAEIAVENGFFAFGQAHFADDFVRLCKVALFGEGFHFFGYVFRLAFVNLHDV